MPTTGTPFTFGDAIIRARKGADLDQAQIADACGVSRQLVSRWENSKSFPDVRQLRAIVELTGAEWLYERDVLADLSMESVGYAYGASDLPEHGLALAYA